MAISKRASGKKAATPKVAEKKVEPEESTLPDPTEEALPDAAQEAVDASVESAQAESEARREVAQKLVDEGKTITGSGQDADGRHYFLVQSQEETPTEVQIYVDEEQS